MYSQSIVNFFIAVIGNFYVTFYGDFAGDANDENSSILSSTEIK